MCFVYSAIVPAVCAFVFDFSWFYSKAISSDVPLPYTLILICAHLPIGRQQRKNSLNKFYATSNEEQAILTLKFT